MIECRNIELGFDSGFQLNIDHLFIRHKAFVVITGANGAGKSVLLKILLNLTKPDKGFVTINGKSNVSDESWKAHTGAYLGESYLMGFLTAKEYFSFITKIKDREKNRTDDWDVTPFYPLCPAEIIKHPILIRDLSTGNQARVGILGALIQQPSLLLLDEPFAHLDRAGQLALKSVLEQLSARGATILLTTHEPDLLRGLATDFITLESGKIIT